MHLWLCTPTRGQLDIQFLECRDAFVAECKKSDELKLTLATTCGSSMLDHARSTTATDFVDDPEKPDVLLWIDDDMVFDYREVLEMAITAELTEGIVGAVSMCKKPLGQVNFIPLAETSTVQFFGCGGLVEIVSIGTGICAVHRKVFEQLLGAGEVSKVLCGPTSVYPFYQTLIHEGQWYGEDSSFCVRARKVGCKVWADTKVRCFHKGSYLYGLEDAGKMLERAATLTMNFNPPTLPSASS